MPAYYDQGFAVREPSWHREETLLDDFPTREEGMRLAGHDFDLIEAPLRVELPFATAGVDPIPGRNGVLRSLNGEWKAIVRSDTGKVLHVPRSTYTIIPNSVGWDIATALGGEGAKYETGMTLQDGAVCLVLVWLDEPVTITGDDSPILPFGVTRWTHDGSGALTCRATNVRVVCSNTDEASAFQARKLGTEFTFRHTAKALDRIEEAKMAIRGIRAAHEEFVELAEELAKTPVTVEQRELFISQFIPSPPETLISERVQNNIAKGRAQVRSLFDGPTIPEAHKLTAYGLRLAGVEYLDHLRGYRSQDTYVGRQLLRTEPAKIKLATLIKEVVAA